MVDDVASLDAANQNLVGIKRAVSAYRDDGLLLPLDQYAGLRQVAEKLAPSAIVSLIRIFTPGPAARGGLRPQLPLELSVGVGVAERVALAVPVGVTLELGIARWWDLVLCAGGPRPQRSLRSTSKQDT